MILFPVCVNLPGILTAILLSKKIKASYVNKSRPPLSPPGWVFGPIWTILYILIGISGYLIWSLEKDFQANMPSPGVFTFFNFSLILYGLLFSSALG
jgi:tryptophan-rich sensory protein